MSLRDEIIVRPRGGTFVGTKASRVSYKRMWPTGEAGSDWVQRLASNPNYDHGIEHPFWYSEKEGMVCLTPALLTEEHPQGDVTIIFEEE